MVYWNERRRNLVMASGALHSTPAEADRGGNHPDGGSQPAHAGGDARAGGREEILTGRRRRDAARTADTRTYRSTLMKTAIAAILFALVMMVPAVSSAHDNDKTVMGNITKVDGMNLMVKGADG